MSHNYLGRRVRCILTADTFDKITFGVCSFAERTNVSSIPLVTGQDRTLTHQVKVDAVIDKIILARLHILRRAEVDAVFLADVLDLLVRARQTDDIRMELAQVLAQHLGRVAGRVAGDENRSHHRGTASRLFDIVDDGGHLVKLIGADIRTVGEAKVNLSEVNHKQTRSKPSGPAYKTVFPLQILMRELVPIEILQHKRTPDLGLAHPLAHLRDAFALQPGLLISEVDDHRSAGNDKQQGCLPREGTGRVTGLDLGHGARCPEWGGRERARGRQCMVKTMVVGELG